MCHWNPGNFEAHPVRAFYVTGEETELSELEAIRGVVHRAFGELPPVATLTTEEKEAARMAVRQAWENYASGRIDGVLVRSDEAGIEALESGTLNGGERVAKGDMLDELAVRLMPLTTEDKEAWLEKLCDGVASDLIGTDWAAVAEAVSK